MLKQAEMLSDLTWHNSGYNRFKIFRPERIINAPFYEDRIGQTWIVEKYIKPYVQPQVLPNNMACQENKGTHETMKRIVAALTECFQAYCYDFWFIQYDMQGFYDNLNHEKVKELFSGLSANGYKLLCNIVDGWQCEDAYALIENPDGIYGVPKGCLPSQWIGILYLNELDHLMVAQVGCLFLIRYMDDAIIFFRTKAECINAKRFIEDYLAENQMGIRLHPNKTNYAPINRGFNFCGWHYEIKPSGKILIHLKQEKKREMEADLKFLQEEYRRGRISWIEAKNKMQGCCKYLEWGDTYHLRKYICNRFSFQRGTESQPCANLAQGETFLSEQEYFEHLAMLEAMYDMEYRW